MKKITGEELGALLFAIHDHHPETEEIIYNKKDLFPILKAIGLPEPIFGKSMKLKEYLKGSK